MLLRTKTPEVVKYLIPPRFLWGGVGDDQTSDQQPLHLAFERIASITGSEQPQAHPAAALLTAA